MRALPFTLLLIFFSLFSTASSACPNASLMIETCFGTIEIGPNGPNGVIELCADIPITDMYYWCSSGPHPSSFERICVREKQANGTYLQVYCDTQNAFSFTPLPGKEYRFDYYHYGSAVPYSVDFVSVDCLDIQAEQTGSGCEGYFLAGMPITIGLNLPSGMNGGCYTYSSEIDMHPYGTTMGLNGELVIDPCMYEKDTCFNVIVAFNITPDLYDPACENCPSFSRLECVKICTRPQTVTERIVIDTTFCDGIAWLCVDVNWNERVYWTTPEGCTGNPCVEGTTSGQYTAQIVNPVNCSMREVVYNVTVDCCIDMECISMPDEVCEGQPICIDVNCDFDFPIWYRWVVTELNGAWEDRVVKAHIEPGVPLGDICISNYWDEFIPGKSYGISLDVCRTCWDGTTKCETKYLFFNYKAKTQYVAERSITCGELINLNDWTPYWAVDTGCGELLYWLDVTNQLGLLGSEVSPQSNTTYVGVYECCEVTYQVTVDNIKSEVNICAEEGEVLDIGLPCAGTHFRLSGGAFPTAQLFQNPYTVSGSESFVVYTIMPNGCTCETVVNIVVPERVSLHAFYCLGQPFFDLRTLIPPGCEEEIFEIIDVRTNTILPSPILTADMFNMGDLSCFRYQTYDANGCLKCIVDITIQALTPPCETPPHGMYHDGSPLGGNHVEDGQALTFVPLDGSLQLYPNPVSGLLRINFEADSPIKHLYLSRANSGEVKLLVDLSTTKFTQYTMQYNTNGNLPGVYTVIAILENGQLISKQLVIE